MAHRPVPARRIVVYVVACLALCIAIWALTEGGERDLYNQPSATVHVLRATILSR